METNASPIRLSANAARRVRELLAEERDAATKLRIYVQGGGCSGFQYGFQFDVNQNEDDMVLHQDGVSVLVDALSFQYLLGAEIDYRDDLQGARFVVENPKAATTCGCGSSFSI